MTNPSGAWAITDTAQAAAALRRVLDLHHERPGDGFLEQTQCMADDFSWPCPTVRAITEDPTKMCVYCARRGTRGFYEGADGPACFVRWGMRRSRPALRTVGQKMRDAVKRAEKNREAGQ